MGISRSLKNPHVISASQANAARTGETHENVSEGIDAFPLPPAGKLKAAVWVSARREKPWEVNCQLKRANDLTRKI